MDARNSFRSFITIIKSDDLEELKVFKAQYVEQFNEIIARGAGDYDVSMLFGAMLSLVKSGNLSTLKEIKDSFPSFWAALVNLKDNNNDTMLLWAAFEGQLDIVDWLINECKADPHVKNAKNLDYFQNLDLGAIKLAKNKDYVKVSRVLEYKGVIFNSKNSHGETLKSVLFATLNEAVVSSDARTLELLILHKITDFLGIKDPMVLREMSVLARAIIDDDLKKVEALLNQSILTYPIYKEESGAFTALGIALKHNRPHIAEYLIQVGAKISDIPDLKYTLRSAKIIKEVTHSRTGLNDVFVTLDDHIKSINASLSKEDKGELKKVQQDKLDFSRNILNQIEKQNISSQVDESPYRKMDLFILINGIATAMGKTDTIEEFKNQLKLILAEREDAIRGTSMDYCFDPVSSANALCEWIARQINPSSPYNLLLHKATTVGRKQAWYHPMEFEEKAKAALPKSDQFFRTTANEIHLYEPVVEAACARIKDGNTLMSHIWFGTDDKNVRPVPPLSLETLSILKQRSPSFRRLIEYTQGLDAYTRLTSDFNVYQRFELLKNGLYAGDYRVTGSHDTAGSAAYAAIASFSEWWNDIKKTSPRLCEEIKSLGHFSSRADETLGDALDILFDQKNLNNDARRTDVSYCINLKAGMIERILKNPMVKQELKAMQFKIPDGLVDFKSMSHTDIDLLKDTIVKELEAPRFMTTIITNTIGGFPAFRILELNVMLMKNGLIHHYTDFIQGENRDSDLKKIIAYVFSEKNNENLFKLRAMLNHDEFDYLRKVEQASLGLFKTDYFATIKGQRTQTNHYYAQFEEVMTAQLVKNASTVIDHPRKAALEVSKLYQQNGFMACHRKHKHHFSTVNHEYLRLISQGKSKDKIQEDLTKKIGQLKHQW